MSLLLCKLLLELIFQTLEKGELKGILMKIGKCKKINNTKIIYNIHCPLVENSKHDITSPFADKIS